MKTLNGNNIRESQILLKNKKNGFTLIELLIVIAITSIITGVVVFTLKTSLDTYYFVQDDVFLQKILDDSLQIVSDGSFEHDGVKDLLEIVEAGKTSFSFVPPWVDDSHILNYKSKKDKTFILNKPFKPGTGFPLAEIREEETSQVYQQIPMTFTLDKQRQRKRIMDKVVLDEDLDILGDLRFIYHPEIKYCRECVMTIKKEKDFIQRRYKGFHTNLIKKIPEHVKLTEMIFQYYDNTNTEIVIDSVTERVDKNKLENISAVKLTLEFEASNHKRKGSVFINLRNTKGAGVGVTIQKGTELEIPNSKDIRVLSLVNIVGVDDGGTISLRATSTRGQTWILNVFLKEEDGKEKIESYNVEFPAGRIVYTEELNVSTSIPLNLLTIGATGRYDYDSDIDKGIEDAVDLEGDVELKVTQMDAMGAALFIRP